MQKNKKMVIAVLALAMLFGLAACGKDKQEITIPEEATGDITAVDISTLVPVENQDIIKDYTGSYQDTTGGRASLNLVPSGDNGGYTMLISWSSSAYELDAWVLEVKYAEGGILYYTNGTHERDTWKITGEVEQLMIKDDLEGYFTINDEGKILWNGASEEMCKECVFAK